GLTNLAIAEGTVCRFTRVVGSGLEGIAAELAERRGIPLASARALLAAVDLRAAAAPAGAFSGPEPLAAGQAAPPPGPLAAGMVETASPTPEVAEPPEQQDAPGDGDVLRVLESGIREICGEVHNSLDFHRSQEGGGEVSRVVLSGSALDLPG